MYFFIIVLYLSYIFPLKSLCLLQNTCLNYNNICTNIISGVTKCKECDFTGWLNTTTLECNFILYNNNIQGNNCTDILGIQRISQEGVLCGECYYHGYVNTNNSQCICYDSSLNPNRYCQPLLPHQLFSKDILLIKEESTLITCKSFQSQQLGCFERLDNDSNGGYGNSNPFTPKKCCSPIYGPPPGQLIEDGKNGIWEECNIYVTNDPDDSIDISYPVKCSGHGDWSTTLYQCICYDNWNAIYIGNSYYPPYEPVYSCRDCYAFWGPLPPLLSSPPLEDVEQLHCSVPYFPDPLSPLGESAECSNHGTFIQGQCQCDRSMETGYWDLLDFTGSYQKVLGNGTTLVLQETIATCAKCLRGYKGNDCTEIDTSITLTPSLPPTNQPTYLFRGILYKLKTTNQPSSSFNCNQYLLPTNTIIENQILIMNQWSNILLVDYYNIVTILNSTALCCQFNSYEIASQMVIMKNISCYDSNVLLFNIGKQLCNQLEQCNGIFSWTNKIESNSVQYVFTNISNFLTTFDSRSKTGI